MDDPLLAAQALRAARDEIRHLAETTSAVMTRMHETIEMLRVEGGYDLRHPLTLPTAREVYEPIFERLDRIFASAG